MPRKKMFPLPPEPDPCDPALYKEVAPLRIYFRRYGTEVLMRFTDHVQWVRMTPAGARKLAALLILKADEAEKMAARMTRS